MKQNSGFGVIGVTLVIAAIALISLVAWRVYETNKGTQTSNDNPSSQVQQPDQVHSSNPTVEYVMIKEWGVKLTINDTIKGATYTLRPNGQSAYLTTPRLTELSTIYSECADADESVSIARSKPGDDHFGSPWQEAELAKVGVKVEDYYYYPALGQPCFLQPSSKAPEDIEKIREALINAIKSVETTN